MARRMVTEWGFSDKLGPLKYSEDQQEVFLGHSVAQTKNMSDATAQLVDSEIRTIVDSAYEQAKKILTDKMDDLVKISEALLEYETLSGEDIRKLLAGEPLNRDEEGDDADAAKPRPTSVPTSSTRREPPGAGIGPTPEPQGT
jgi:cell division protease FtsH